MKTIYITRKLPALMVDQLRPYYKIKEWHKEDVPVPKEELLQQVTDADALWTLVSDPINKELIDVAPQLKIVSNFAVGYNNIEVSYLKEKGIIVTNTPNVLNDATADLAFSLMLATARRIPQYMELIKKNQWGGWSPYFGAGLDVANKTLGVIGMGNIGQTLVKRSVGFDMKVLYHNRSRNEKAEQLYNAEYCELDDLLARADFVVIFAPLTEQTRNLITLEKLKLMKPTAVLINAARGGIVNEQDLYTALKENIIWAAGSDVFESEPISSEHPLLALDNFVATPHIGSGTLQTRNAMMQMNVDAFIAFAKGEEVHNQI